MSIQREQISVFKVKFKERCSWSILPLGGHALSYLAVEGGLALGPSRSRVLYWDPEINRII